MSHPSPDWRLASDFPATGHHVRVTPGREAFQATTKQTSRTAQGRQSSQPDRHREPVLQKNRRCRCWLQHKEHVEQQAINNEQQTTRNNKQANELTAQLEYDGLLENGDARRSTHNMITHTSARTWKPRGARRDCCK